MTVRQRSGPFSDTKDAKRFPWVAACDTSNCYFVVSASDEQGANDSLAGHTCPAPGGIATYADLPNVQQKLWRALDGFVDGLMLAKSGDEAAASKMEYMKGVAQGLAIAIVGMQSYMPDERAVSREASLRYKMRIGEVEYSRTPGDGYDPLRDGVGLGEERWQWRVDQFHDVAKAKRATIDPPPNLAPPRPRQPRPARPAAPRVTAPAYSGPPPALPNLPSLIPGVSPAAHLPEDVRNGIKNSLAAGFFGHEQIASMFQVSVAAVAALAE